jgi:hypothetical protein
MTTCRTCGIREAMLLEMTGYLVNEDDECGPPPLPPAPGGPTLCMPCLLARFPESLHPYILGQAKLPPPPGALPDDEPTPNAAG